MAQNDPIADLLTQIRNASRAKHRYVDMPSSRMKTGILKILKEQGFIIDFLEKSENNKSMVRILLKYTKDRLPVLNGLKRVSKPGLRQYIGSHEIPRVLGGMGITILTTPRGVMEGEEARRNKVGGELLCTVW